MIEGKVERTVIYSGEQTLAINGNAVEFNYKYRPSILAGSGVMRTVYTSNSCRPCRDYSVRFRCLKTTPESKVSFE